MLKTLVKLEHALIITFCLALAGLMVVQVLLRYVFVAPFLGVEEVAVMLGLWIYFLGLVHVTRTRQHISSGVLQFFIKSKGFLKALEVVKITLCLVSSCIFLYFAIQYWFQTFESERASTYLTWPTVLWVTSMVFGFTLSSLLFLAHFWLLVTGREEPMDHQEEIEHMAR